MEAVTAVMQAVAPLFSAAALVAVAVIETRNKKCRARTEARARRRAEESQLSMELMSATCKLATATAKAVTGQHTNGDVEDALEAAQKAQEAYDTFLARVTARQVAKV